MAGNGYALAAQFYTQAAGPLAAALHEVTQRHAHALDRDEPVRKRRGTFVASGDHGGGVDDT